MPAWTAACARNTRDRFIREDGLVICATIAFGMGIDKPMCASWPISICRKAWSPTTRKRVAPDATDCRADAWMVLQLADIVQIRQLLDQFQRFRKPSNGWSANDSRPCFAYCEHAGCRRPGVAELLRRRPSG